MAMDATTWRTWIMIVVIVMMVETVSQILPTAAVTQTCAMDLDTYY